MCEEICEEMCLENREEEQKRGVEEDMVGDAAGDALLEKDTPWQRRDTPNRNVACRQPMLDLGLLNRDCVFMEGPMQKQVHP